MTIDLDIKGRLLSLINLIDKLKTQLAVAYLGNSHTEPLLEAMDEIEAILKTTEESTTTILLAVENINHLCENASPEFVERINGHIFSILEASNYQDINSQRLIKITNILKELYIFYSQNSTKPAAKSGGSPKTTSLLNGPQLPDKAPTQQDVDDIFSQ